MIPKTGIETAWEEVEEEQEAKRKKQESAKQHQKNKRKGNFVGDQPGQKRQKAMESSTQTEEAASTTQPDTPVQQEPVVNAGDLSADQDEVWALDREILLQQEPWMAAILLSEEEKAARLRDLLEYKAARANAPQQKTITATDINESDTGVDGPDREASDDAEQLPEVVENTNTTSKLDKGKGRAHDTPVGMVNAGTQTDFETAATEPEDSPPVVPATPTPNTAHQMQSFLNVVNNVQGLVTAPQPLLEFVPPRAEGLHQSCTEPRARRRHVQQREEAEVVERGVLDLGRLLHPLRSGVLLVRAWVPFKTRHRSLSTCLHICNRALTQREQMVDGQRMSFI